MDKTQQKSGTGAGSANGLPQPIQDGLGATMLGPHNVPGDETRRFLEDGDRVTMTAWCQGAGYRVGFGEVTGVVRAALAN